MDRNDTGLLLNKNNITLHRTYFKEMVKLLGINVIYKAPRPDKHYTDYGEVESNYYESTVVGCIFDEHPTQQTLRKLGWASELQENSSIIHVPYDLKGLQQGALFIVPSGIDGAEGRVFRVIKLSNIMIYPASISCEIAPEYANDFDRTLLDVSQTDFNLLYGEDD